MRSTLNIGENILNLRRERRITQEQLAEFIGVTKASVSKWETGQSTPDILLLPCLATYFDVTVDELLGYCPQLSKEQIIRIYQEFSAEFAKGCFEEVMDKTWNYVKKYYSCYPFLFQICVLWLNHYMLAEEGEGQKKILWSVVELCGHIREHCQDIGISNNAIVIQGMAYLSLGQAEKVVDIFEDRLNSDKLTEQGGMLLTQAYMMLGDREKAECNIQIAMYSAVMSLVGNATHFLSVSSDNLKICEETVRRVERVAETYDFIRLHPNNMAVFEYQAAVCYGIHEEKEKALEHMGRYVICLEELFHRDEMTLHGDAYFHRIEEWLKEPLGSTVAPRDRKLIIEDSKQAFAHPAFQFLENESRFQRLKEKVNFIK